MRALLIRLVVVGGACLAAWFASGYWDAHDDLYANIGAAFVTASYLLLFNSMPIGHGVGRYRRILWIPMKLLFFYAVFSLLAVLLIMASNNPLLEDSLQLTRSFGVSVLAACVLALIEWYVSSGPATAYSPPEDDPAFVSKHVSARLTELAKGAAPRKE